MTETGTEYGEARAPQPIVPILKTTEIQLLLDRLRASGWADMKDQRLDIRDVIEDHEEWVFQRESSETIMRLEDQGNHIGATVSVVDHNEWTDDHDDTPQEVFRANHIGPQRLLALLHIMGIVRAEDSWMEWFESEVWR